MDVNILTPIADTLVKRPAPEKVDREQKEARDDLAPSAEALEEKKAQGEEILDKIKALTEDGLYSVRFEMDDKVNQMVVRVVDQDTDEVIRQVPAEEILGMMAAIREFRGQIVDSAT